MPSASSFRLRRTAVCLIILLPYLASLQAQERIKRLDELPLQARERLDSIFGPAAADAFVVEEAFARAKEGRQGEEDRADADAALERLSRLDARSIAPADRKKVATAWRQAAAYAKYMDGPTEEALLLLETALTLDPDNLPLAQEVSVERTRKRLVAERIKELRRIEETLARGEDPWEDSGEIGNGANLRGKSGNSYEGRADQ